MNSTSSTEEVTTWTTNQVVFATIFVVCVFFSFWLLYRLRVVVFLLFIAIVLGTAIRPAVEWLHRHGISRISGVIIIYAVIAALLIGFLALTWPFMADQGTRFAQHLPEYYADIRGALVNSGNRLLRNIGWRIPSKIQALLNNNPTTEEVVDQVARTFFYTNLVVKGLLSVVAIFLLAFYWTLESNVIIRALLRFVPLSRRMRIREFLDLAELRIGGYIRGQGILCLAVGSAAFISYTLIGLPYALVLAIIAGLMEMVPIFGPALGAIPAVLVALSTDPGKAIWVLIATGVIQMMENAWLVPRIMNSSMGVNPIIILLSLVGFSSVFGFPGALLALPLAALVQLVLDRMILSPDQATARSPESELGLHSLINENQELLRLISPNPGSRPPSVNGMSEADWQEIGTITQELDALLGLLKRKEDEAA